MQYGYSHPRDISVVMSVYNGAEYLRESIESILSQEGVDLEFIIIDDGSTDESGRILDEYANRDERVTVIHQENTGLTKALIRGCAEVCGQYIARQDAGDISLPGRLALQKAALDADNTLSFVSCWTEYVGPEWEFLYLTKGTGAAINAMGIISERAKWGVVDGPTHHSAVMFRKYSYLNAGAYRPQFYFGQDWDLWYRLAEIGKFQMLQKVLYQARISPGSISASNKSKQETLAGLSLQALLNRLKGLPEGKFLAEAGSIRPEAGIRKKTNYSSGFYFVGECLRKNGDPRAARYFVEALKRNPFFLKAWLRLGQSLLQRGSSLQNWRGFLCY